MNITDVAWIRDHQRRPTLELAIDGHRAHIHSSQKAELIKRGIVDGITLLASEKRAQVSNIFVRGDFGPNFSQADLRGCTDDPQVFGLYEDMCRAILAGTWRPGPRENPPEVRSSDRPDEPPVGLSPGDRAH